MKKNGFTLVEVIAVIAILSILIVIVAPIINNSSNNTKNKSYTTKISFIEDAAVLYGQDNYRTIINNAKNEIENYEEESTTTITYYHFTMKVKDLYPDYIKEKDSCEPNKCISDPRNNDSYLDLNEVIITINPNTKKVTAEYIEETT